MPTRKPSETSRRRINKAKTKTLAFAALLFEKTAISMGFVADLLRREISIEIKVVKNKKEKEVK